MYLKRLYAKDASGAVRQAANGRPVVAGVRILRCGRKQKFSPELIQSGATDGWLSLADGKVTIWAEDRAHVFRIVRAPGMYCCHCGAAVHDAGGARAHLAAEHAGKVSPDPENPAGYMRTHAFKTVRE